MTKFESSIKPINYPVEAVYRNISDLSNLERVRDRVLFRSPFTKENPFTSHTYEFPWHLNISNPQIFCLKCKTIFLAISFSLGVKFIGYLTSFPSAVLLTFPSKQGLFLASA